MEFNGEHVGMLIFGIQNCLAKIVILHPSFGVYLQPKSSSAWKGYEWITGVHSND